MKKKHCVITIALLLFFNTITVAQIGVGTNNPQGVLHIDGAKDNAATGVPTATQQRNDVIITAAGKVGIGTIAPANSASLEINSTTMGFLPPRMTSAQMFGIQTPAEGLVIYCTNCTPKGLQVFNGANWTDMVGSITSNILYKWDFESASPLNNLLKEESTPNTISIVNDPLNANNKVQKFVLEPTHNRTEVLLMNSSLSNILFYYSDAAPGFTDQANTIASSTSLGSEMWCSFKIMIPMYNNTSLLKPCFFQFGPVQNPAVSSGAGFIQLRVRNPPNTLTGDNWNLRIFTGNSMTPSSLNLPAEIGFSSQNINIWERIVVHIRYSTTSNGIIEVWHNGVKYINIVGSNAIPLNRNRIKWGIYSGIDATPMTVYFDDVKIGGANCSYEEISQ